MKRKSIAALVEQEEEEDGEQQEVVDPVTPSRQSMRLRNKKLGKLKTPSPSPKAVNKRKSISGQKTVEKKDTTKVIHKINSEEDEDEDEEDAEIEKENKIIAAQVIDSSDEEDDDDEMDADEEGDEEDEESGSEEEKDSDEEEESEDDEDEAEDEDDENEKPFDFTGVEEELQQIESEKNLESPHPKPLLNPLLVNDGDEYDKDSSDEEDLRNTVGNIPLNWYDEYPHIGYDLDGRKLIKPKLGDKLDDFLRRMEDPDFWRTVKDKQTGQNVVLSDADFELIERLQSGKMPNGDFNAFEPWIEWFSSTVMETPLRNMPPSKTSFLPSKIDKMKISKMVHAIKMGWMKPKPKESDEPQFYMLWESDDKADEMRRIHDHIPAPKIRLPTNAESYNPPGEYLFDDQEMKDWEKRSDEPWKRKYNFIPQKHKRLLDVPAYSNYIKERFERCLDLYLCPRAKKMRLTIKAEDLVPQLPNPRDLQPFPTVCSMIFKGHTSMVRSISLEPGGQFLASGSDDGTVKIWEIATGRCLKTYDFVEQDAAEGSECAVRSVEWCPNKSLCLLAVAAESDLFLINPGVGDKLVVKKTDALLQDGVEQGEYKANDKVANAVTWESLSLDDSKWARGTRIVIRHFKRIHQVTWHAKGDYFSTVMQEGQNKSVLIHQLSSRRSQLPLNRSKGLIQCVLFHPVRPFFFIATQRHVRIYNLVQQEMVKKLMTGAKWISSISVHPGGDNVLVGTYDKKVMWFDLDLSTKPYQTMRFHGNAIRSVAYHKRYPLFATGGDDCSLIVSHGMVYNDLLQNPLIVPVKKLRGHEKFSDFGILSVIFHNMQPWVFSSGADKTIRLFT